MERIGWKLIRVKYNPRNALDLRKDTFERCREMIKTKLIPLLTDKEFYDAFKCEYVFTKEELAKVIEEHKPKNDFDKIFD